MINKPFAIFPWQRPFLPDLKAWVEEKTDHNCGAATIIVPNRRPWRHLCELFRSDKKAAALPKVFTFAEIINLWKANLPQRPLREANTLDQVALLEECINSVARDDQVLSARFAGMEMRQFLPWGLRLAKIYEELFIQGREAMDLANLEYEVAGPASALLGALGKIGVAYRDALEKRNWTTPGHVQYMAGKYAGQIPRRLAPGEDRPVFIAGFAIPNGTENKIFRSLWNAGAQICLHTDPLIANKKGFHESCADHFAWLRSWKAQGILAFEPPEEDKKPEIRFFSGYDAHSQLAQLSGEIEKNPEMSTVVALADESLLMPTLHQLKGKSVNISMGYPLAQSPLGMLLKAVFALHENDIGDGRHYWKDVQAIVVHPYLKLLSVDDGAEYLKEPLGQVDEFIRSGGARITAEAIEDAVLTELEGAMAVLFDEFLQIVFKKPLEIQSFAELAAYLKDFLVFLRRNGGDMWDSFPLDAEAMHRIANNVLPALENNELAHRELPLPALLDFLRKLLDEERIPFTSEKFDNIQILGMLETRLLNFERVFFLDATDDVLPGSIPRDPLLPNSLRAVLGLPDGKSREKAMGHTLYRLCRGAKEAHFYWQEGVSHSDVSNGKKSRSRFVEQLIWEEEKNRFKNILEPGDSILRVANAPISTTILTPNAIEADEAISARLRKVLAGKISATALDCYIQCPLKFAYQYLLKIRLPREASEGDNAMFAGQFVHKALQLLLQPYIGRHVDVDKILAEDGIQKSFDQAWQETNPGEILPAHSQLKLEGAYFLNIRQFLENFPRDSVIESLEQNIRAEPAFICGPHTLAGRVDRVDSREGKFHILDYKTGKVSSGNAELWKNGEFFSNIAALCRQKDCKFEELAKNLDYMREELPSLQLPVYLAILGSGPEKGRIANAAFVELSGQSEEKNLFIDLDEEQTRTALDYCRLCIDLTLKTIGAAPVFGANVTSRCQYCPYNEICAS